MLSPGRYTTFCNISVTFDIIPNTKKERMLGGCEKGVQFEQRVYLSVSGFITMMLYLCKHDIGSVVIQI